MVDFHSLPHRTVIIIGGGFAGLQLVKHLHNKPLKVILLDRNNYHTFQPLLYQVASGGLGSDAIAYPFRKIIGKMPNVAFRMAEVDRVDPQANTVHTNIGNFHYDYLVIATGAETNYFGNKNVETMGMPLKSIPDALDIRSLILQEFEKALIQKDMEQQRKHMTFVIVGAGPTGVELAGALAEFKRTVLPKDYTELNQDYMEVHLLDAQPRVLAAMSEQASSGAYKYLEKMGVILKLGVTVTDYDGETVKLNNGEEIKSDTVIWAAGVKGKLIPGLEQATIVRGNRYKVDAYNKVAGYENIFAVGDVAAIMDEKTPNGHPMLASVAKQNGRHLARNLVAMSTGRPVTPFKYNDKGSMATIGRNRAVVDLPFLKFKGLLAWLAWMFIHLMLLVSFRNRLIVLVNWVWNYFTYERTIRLIVRPFQRKQIQGKP